jgi:hypothetical protein
MSSLRHKILCSATSLRYTEIIASILIAHGVTRYLVPLIVSSTSSKGGFTGPDRKVWAFFLGGPFRLHPVSRGAFSRPTMMSGCEKNMPTPTKTAKSLSKTAPSGKPLTPADYLKKILTARVYDVAVESSLEPAKNLGLRLKNTVLLKREDQQPVFSFKLRGAYNKMAHLSPAQLKKGVICASAGNHAQGVALSAQKLGTRAVIVMPTTTPQLKVDAVRAWGGEVVLHGDSYSDAYGHAVVLEKKRPDLCSSVR